MAWISSRARFSMPSNPSGILFGDSLHEQDFLHPVDFLKFDFDDLVGGGLYGAPDVAGGNGQLAMTAVDQDEKLNASGAALVEEGVESGSNGAAGIEDIVHQDDVFPDYGERNVG